MLKVSSLSFHAGTAVDRLLGPHSLPPRLTVALYHDFLQNFLPELLQYVDLLTRIHLRFMHDGAQPHFLLAVRECLKQRVSGKVDRTRWTNSPGCFFLWFKFLSLGISKVCCLCYGSQWRPGLATYNTEWIWEDSYDTWKFPASQAVTVRTCSVLRWSSSGKSLSIFFHLHQAVTRKPRFGMPVFIKLFFLVLWCRFTFCKFGRAFFVHPV